MSKDSLFNPVFFLLIAYLVSSCHPVRYDGPYKGKVIDAETGAPIEGVVVLGVWYKQITTPAGGVSSYYDAQETATDKNGQFELSGLGLKVFSNVEPMDVLVFKTGYQYIGLSPWDSFKLDGILKRKIKWEGDLASIPLRKLSMEERQNSSSFPPHPDVPEEKMTKMNQEMKKEREERGLKIDK